MNEIVFNFMYNNFFNFFDESLDIVFNIGEGSSMTLGGWLGLVFVIVFDCFMVSLGYKFLRFVFNLFRGF